MNIKIFTMVKNEVDIVDDWIKYHGTIFGYSNLYIIDNMSDDGTYERILKYIENGIQIYRKDDYKKKGEYMKELMNMDNNYDIAYPIDIDEFIVYYDKEQHKIFPFKTLEYMNSLPLVHNIFKANYIQALITNGSNYGYNRSTIESESGKYDDYKGMAKTFFNKHTFSGEIDHGNHYYTEEYYLTNICLVHYHCRNLEQMKQKVINNVTGLGYDATNLESLLAIANTNGCNGLHHVKHMISILQNTFSINTNARPGNNEQFINLKPLSKLISIL